MPPRRSSTASLPCQGSSHEPAGVTPAARLAASIELLTEIDAFPRRPADAVANDFFRSRRFIGSGDRRAVSDRAWRVLRARRRLTWWIEQAKTAPTPRMLVAASLLLEGWTAAGVMQSYSGGQYGAAPMLRLEADAARALEGHTLTHPEMPAAIALEIPDWLLPYLQARFGDRLNAEIAATLDPAPLDLRVNLLKGTRDEAPRRPGRRRPGHRAHADLALGAAHRRASGGDDGCCVPKRARRNPGRGQPARRRPGRRGTGDASGGLVRRRRRQDAGARHADGQPRPPHGL